MQWEVLQLQQQLTPGLLDFESRNSPLLSSRIPISEHFQTFLFFFILLLSRCKKLAWTKHIFLRTGNLNFRQFRFRFPFWTIRLGKALRYVSFKKRIGPMCKMHKKKVRYHSRFLRVILAQEEWPKDVGWWCFSKKCRLLKKRFSNLRIFLFHREQTFEWSTKGGKVRKRTLHHEAIAQKRGYVRSRVRSSSNQVSMTCTTRAAFGLRGNTSAVSFQFERCLLWIVKARAKDKTYKRMSVRWKTTN